MVKSKKNELKKEKDDVRKEFEKLMFDNPDVSQELFDTIIELFRENTAFRKKFGLESVDTSKTPPATIDNPIYSGIVDQLLQGKKITKALECVGESLSKTDVAIVKQWKCFEGEKTKDVKKAARQVKRFYYDTAGGQNRKNIEKTVRRLQRHIDTPIYAEVVVQLLQGKSIESALTDAGEALGKTESQMSAFYNRGDYKKYIQNNFKQAQKLIDKNKK